MENYETEFLKDIKEEKKIKDIIDNENECENSLDLLMHFFATSKEELGELENSDFAKDNYKELAWNDKAYFDVINSFWTTFTWAMHCSNREKYWIAEAGNVKNVYKNPYRNYQSFPEKYNDKVDEAESDVKEMLDIFPKVKELAKLCHCTANFTQCPDRRFNGLKGRLFEVKDYFPLMIDKIQKHIDENYAITYNRNDTKITVDELKEWRNWFVDNREKYCLQDYYYVISYKDETKRLVGIPLFKGQSLEYPVPKREDEVKECLEEMLKRIETRAMRMARKMEQ